MGSILITFVCLLDVEKDIILPQSEKNAWASDRQPGTNSHLYHHNTIPFKKANNPRHSTTIGISSTTVYHVCFWPRHIMVMKMVQKKPQENDMHFLVVGKGWKKNIESLIIHCRMCVCKFYDVFCDAFWYFLVWLYCVHIIYRWIDGTCQRQTAQMTS